MTDPISRYPLQWPVGWKRTTPGYRQSARFGKSRGYNTRGKVELSVYDGVHRVLQELERMGVSDADIVVSTNVETRLDGLPRSDRAAPGDPGVAVYWRTNGANKVMAIDIYDRVADNLAAVAATLDAMRAIERHGGAAILDRAFTGFTALPAPVVAGMAREWWDVLQVSRDAPREEIKSAYRRLSSQHHPDKGGNAAKMAEINAAFDRAKGTQ